MSALLLLPPTPAQLLGALGVALAVAMLVGLSAVSGTARGLAAAVPFCGWQVLALVLTLVGMAGLPLSYGFWPLVAASLGGLWLMATGRSAVSGMQDLRRILILGLPLLLVLAAKFASEVDSFTHWLPNAEYLVRNDRLPGGSGPPSLSFFPGFPHNLTFVFYAASRLSGLFVENAVVLFNGILLLVYAALLGRLVTDAWTGRRDEHAVGWRVAALAILLAILVNPVFVRKIALNSYPDLATSVGVAVAGILAWRFLDALARQAAARGYALQLILTLALLVNVKQANLALCLSLAVAAAVVAWRDPAIRLRAALPWLAAAALAALAMQALWRLHLATGLPLKENTLLPFAEWQFGNLPAIFATMGKVLLQKAGYGAVTLALVLAAARALIRGPGPFGRLALLAAGTFAGYTLFLILIYIGHFQGSASTGAQSYWRFNTHLGYFAWAAALVGLAQLLAAYRQRDRLERLFVRWGAALPVLALSLPILGAGLIRYDMETPKPLIREVAHDLMRDLPPEADAIGFIPWDNGSLGAMLIYQQRKDRPDLQFGTLREMRAVESAFAERGDGVFLWVYCRTDEADRFVGGVLRPGESTLLRREQGVWRPVQRWSHRDDSWLFGLSKTLDWDACTPAGGS
ncbi:MAG: hypothetical protein AB7G39_08575 [Alphaproteobacteria bacterium]